MNENNVSTNDHFFNTCYVMIGGTVPSLFFCKFFKYARMTTQYKFEENSSNQGENDCDVCTGEEEDDWWDALSVGDTGDIRLCSSK
jgi:hypothetical protein